MCGVMCKEAHCNTLRLAMLHACGAWYLHAILDNASSVLWSGLGKVGQAVDPRPWIATLSLHSPVCPGEA